MAITRREFVRGLAVLSSGTAHSRALSALHTSPAGAGDSAIVFENTTQDCVLGYFQVRAVQISGVVNIAALISLDKRVLEPGTAKPGWVPNER